MELPDLSKCRDLKLVVKDKERRGAKRRGEEKRKQEKTREKTRKAEIK